MEATNSKKTQLHLPRRFEWRVFVVTVMIGAILICSSLELSKPLQSPLFSSQLLQNREEDVESLMFELDALRKQLDEEKLKNKFISSDDIFMLDLIHDQWAIRAWYTDHQID